MAWRVKLWLMQVMTEREARRRLADTCNAFRFAAHPPHHLAMVA